MSKRSFNLAAAAWAVLAVWVAGCQNDPNRVLPNRVLDRPTDAAVACVQRVDGVVQVLASNVCASDTAPRCDQEAVPQLIGFVTNSERNEVALFRRCDRDQAVVDLDLDAPGHQLVPVGTLPTRITRADDSCNFVTANVGSCDLSVLNTEGFAAYALQTDDRGGSSGLTSTIVPVRSDGVPLAAAPGDIVAVPRRLSLAAGDDLDPMDDGGEDGGVDGDDGMVDDGNDEDGDGDTGGDPDVGDLDDGADDADDGATGDGGIDLTPTECGPEASGSIYATFPTCQLVAEIDLATGLILQSVRVSVEARAGGDVVVLEDTGRDPSCPVECPAQLADDQFLDRPDVAADGVFPSALALATIPDEFEAVDADPREYDALFVGGAGSDFLVELEIGPDGGFLPVVEPAQVPLEDAQGVQTIRVTPLGSVDGGDHQFLYVIAGDGSTHVVDRDFDPGALGIECDTQVDPTQSASSACHPVEPGLDNTASRRAFASGPGIRPDGNITITDWSFVKLDQAIDEGELEAGSVEDLAISPFQTPGIIGVGITSAGLVTYASFGQVTGGTGGGVDPVGLMNTELRAHTLWPRLDPATGAADALPLVSDEEPARSFGAQSGDAFPLAPSIRRIDRAYAVPIAESGIDLDSISVAQQRIAAALYTPGPDESGEGFVVNRDQQAGFDAMRLYGNPVARVNVRDYVLWRSQAWALQWEGTIPGTGSGTGLIRCDDHGRTDANGNAVAGGTCRSSAAGDVRLVDESANLCDDGVLAGDKLVLRGCADDGNCGLGQRCLRAATGPASATGICVSEVEYEANLDALRAECAPFISDPCGTPIREYRITRAFQDELWIQAMDVPDRSIVREVDGQLYEWTAKLSCAAPVPHRDDAACRSDDDCNVDPYAPEVRPTEYACEIPEGADSGRCGPRTDTECLVDEDCAGFGLAYACVDDQCRAPCNLCAPDGPQPADGCVVDDDCVAALGEGHTCFAGVCHQPCTDDSPGCIQAPLPGPRCFPEFVNYAVRLKDSFLVEGGATPFFTDGIAADPQTRECIKDPQTNGLLTSRLRLGADEEDTFGHPVWGIPDCPNADLAEPSDPNPCRITGSRGDPGNELFHWFQYNGEQVEAIRFTNPYMSIVVDLTSLLDLAQDDPESGLPWPASMSRYVRGRIPRGYTQEFVARDGYAPFNEPTLLNQNGLVYPVRIVPGPEDNVVFIVDAGGSGGFSPRGQVFRVLLSAAVAADQDFKVQ